MKFTARLICLITCIVLYVPAVNADSAEQKTVDAHDPSICSPDGIALGGHDAVAYHTENQAAMGSSDISVEHDGLTYLFTKVEHRDLFVEDPVKYLPHFRGWCAIALARNRLTCPEYTNFKVEDGKLLLFETLAFVNGRTVWDSDPIQNLISAEANYSRFMQQ